LAGVAEPCLAGTAPRSARDPHAPHTRTRRPARAGPGQCRNVGGPPRSRPVGRQVSSQRSSPQPSPQGVGTAAPRSPAVRSLPVRWTNCCAGAARY